MSDDNKPFLEHLEDLRSTILKSAAVLLVTTLGCCVFIREIIAFLKMPLDRVISQRGLDDSVGLRTLGIVDPLTITLEIGVFSGVILALPFILYFIGCFLLPALNSKEKKLLLPTFLAGALLFIIGVAFCYWFVMPAALGFFIDYNAWLGLKPEWTIQFYIDFLLQMLIAFGVSFELPLILVILGMLELITSEGLRNYRRHAIIIIVTFAAAITPTADPFNLGMLAIPMYFLFEISIWVIAAIEAKRRNQNENDLSSF